MKSVFICQQLKLRGMGDECMDGRRMYGGMGEECKKFTSNLAAKLAQKDNKSYPTTMN